MMTFTGRGILLDIEGTTSSIHFVYDVLFPYARQHAASYLTQHGQTEAVFRALDLLAKDAGFPSRAAWLGDPPTSPEARERVLAVVGRLMDGDVKATGLKELQGLIWAEGYREGTLRSHVYPDVPPTLREWVEKGLILHIFSSGSVAAQKAFFGHTEAGDLLPLFQGHHDTTLGPKRDPESYQKIAQIMGLPPPELLFLSDVVAELDAAQSAGFQTGLVIRPGNPPQTGESRHPILRDFREIHVVRP